MSQPLWCEFGVTEFSAAVAPGLPLVVTFLRGPFSAPVPLGCALPTPPAVQLPYHAQELSVELGILSLSDLQTDPATGTLRDAGRRTREIVSYAVAADQAGLDVFGLGEHHSPDFTVANPAVPLAAIAQATSGIRLTSAVSVLTTADPVRLHQDFASLDLLSDGRAEIIVGRSAFSEAFSLFGVGLDDYDEVFTEKLRSPSTTNSAWPYGN